MSVNKKTDDKIKKAAAYAFSAFCGAVATALLILAFSGVMYALGMPPHLAGGLSLVAFGAGCAVCGFVCGSIKQRGGLRIGLICACIMTLGILAGTLLFGEADGGSFPAKLITASLSACVGSVCAVNRRRE